jgi:hypothetical protein
MYRERCELWAAVKGQMSATHWLSRSKQLAFLVRARVAELLDHLRRAVVQSVEVASLLLRHAAPSVAVDAADSSVQIPANTSSHWVHGTPPSTCHHGSYMIITGGQQIKPRAEEPHK